MNQSTTADLRIDIVSDVVCPWCIIGYRQLQRALEQTDLNADIHWQPFELNPHMAADGENLREHLAAKYGTTSEGSVQARARLSSLGTELGFSFNYTDDMRMYNTFRAHQLLDWAFIYRRQHDLKMALFSAFFTHRRNIDDPEILADTAAAVGLDRQEALAVLADGRYADSVREAQRFWLSQGIQGVPAMIFDKRHLLTGAQGVDNTVLALRQLVGALSH